ncbi:MAG: V-type ATP synthase subunit F [Parasporobacterium sp.]|nr:V-type ATP synthase subunit F [Parasporobacterium sp.]
MKMFVIADNTETFAGMRLAGIDGVIVHEKEEFSEVFTKALHDPEIGILMIMDDFYRAYSDMVLEAKLKYSTPLIMSIPAKGQPAAITEAVSSYIGDAIGIKI